MNYESRFILNYRGADRVWRQRYSLIDNTPTIESKSAPGLSLAEAKGDLKRHTEQDLKESRERRRVKEAAIVEKRAASKVLKKARAPVARECKNCANFIPSIDSRAPLGECVHEVVLDSYPNGLPVGSIDLQYFCRVATLPLFEEKKR